MNKIGLVCFGVLLGLVSANKSVFAMSCCDSGSMDMSQGSKDSGKKLELEISTATAYLCPAHVQESVTNEPGKCPVCGKALEAKEVESTGVKKDASYDEASTQSSHVYTCPMHPEVQSDKPGRCPKCGMNLVEKQVESGTDTGKQSKAHDMQGMSGCH